MKIGVTLPQFNAAATPAIDSAHRAEDAGLDGVFVFDHLWPIGRPDRPALHGLTLASALLVETQRVAVGTLVARVGLLPDAVLVHAFATLARIGGHRLVAGLGVGDKLSQVENLAYGVPFRPRSERLASLVDVCRALRARGITTWVGGNSATTRAVGRAEADAVNLWGMPPSVVADEVGPATWAGQVDVSSDGDVVVAHLRAVAEAGATWAVVAPVGTGWPEAVESIASAAGALVD